MRSVDIRARLWLLRATHSYPALSHDEELVEVIDVVCKGVREALDLGGQFRVVAEAKQNDAGMRLPEPEDQLSEDLRPTRLRFASTTARA